MAKSIILSYSLVKQAILDPNCPIDASSLALKTIDPVVQKGCKACIVNRHRAKLMVEFINIIDRHINKDDILNYFKCDSLIYTTFKGIKRIGRSAPIEIQRYE